MARNRAKRRLREAVARTAVPSGVDCILVASAQVNEASFEQLIGCVTEAFAGIGAGGALGISRVAKQVSLWILMPWVSSPVAAEKLAMSGYLEPHLKAY